MESTKREYIERLQMVMRQLHGLGLTWEKTRPVEGQTVWEGDAEVWLQRRRKANRE